MAMTAVKIPPSWKNDLVTLRDSLDEGQGGEAIATLAALAVTENGQELLAQLGPLLEAVRASPRSTLEAIAAVVEGEAVGHATLASTALLSPEPAPQNLLGRGVPYGLVGLLGRILDVALDDPSRAREALLRTEKLL